MNYNSHIVWFFSVKGEIALSILLDLDCGRVALDEWAVDFAMRRLYVEHQNLPRIVVEFHEGLGRLIVRTSWPLCETPEERHFVNTKKAYEFGGLFTSQLVAEILKAADIRWVPIVSQYAISIGKAKDLDWDLWEVELSEIFKKAALKIYPNQTPSVIFQ